MDMQTFRSIDLSASQETTIPAATFTMSTALEKIVLPAMCLEIGEGALQGCSYLRHVAAAASPIAFIGDNAFSDTSGLRAFLPQVSPRFAGLG
jgi:hypothetical protein